LGKAEEQALVACEAHDDAAANQPVQFLLEAPAALDVVYSEEASMCQAYGAA
jgi:hypothetical protein